MDGQGLCRQICATHDLFVLSTRCNVVREVLNTKYLPALCKEVISPSLVVCMVVSHLKIVDCHVSMLSELVRGTQVLCETKEGRECE